MTTAVALALLCAAGCSSDGDDSPGDSDGSRSPRDSASPSRSQLPAAPAKGKVTVERTVATGLNSPWGLAPLPDGDLLVSSRDTGRIQHIDAKSGKKTTIGSVPGVEAEGEGGLLGLAVSPTFAKDRLVYAYFTTASDNRIARMVYNDKRDAGEQLGAPDTVLRGIPKGSIHNGGRIAFGPDKMLYAGTGESGEEDLSQDKDSLAGKILRMTPDGDPPGHGNPESDSVVYSWGHRNVQGLAWDRDKRLWASEFGQDTWDELNAIEPGRNYGWPEVEGRQKKKGMTPPVEQWKTSEASPSGIAVNKGSVWMAGLRGERLWRIPLQGRTSAADPQDFLQGDYGRLRTVVSAGEGHLWLVTSATDGRGDPGRKDDRVLRLKVS
ncbi:PQQ-dependent sugar dehydrogenase [Streptomyces sp. NPDC005438]|uniref:PQQ-dependent sugar dehydrogenase n=1 Tax=Streptomyces sp. NPDC005438 TaxID=3156880 RepID=UPI0033A510E9